VAAASILWEGHVLALEVDRTRAPRSMLVTVTVDSEDLARFEEPGWRELGIGVGHGAAYWWSARHLVAVSTDGAIHEISVDEDILIAFARPDGWLLVCETSARLFDEQRALSRVEFPDVVRGAQVRGERLYAELADDARVEIEIGARELS
jgi:hypothetical protein